MNKDIVERLRELAIAADEQTSKKHGDFHREIADEIERLRTQLAEAQLTIAEACHEMDCSSVQDWDSSLSRAWQLLQDASDKAMQEKT